MKKILILCFVVIISSSYGNTKSYKKGQKSFDKKKYAEAEKYYLIAVNDEGSVLAMRGLGYVYRKENKYDLSEKYFKMGIENGDETSIIALGSLYKKENKYDEAEELFKMGKVKGIERAKFGLGEIYLLKEEYALAEENLKEYLLTDEYEGFKREAMEKLAELYRIEGKYDLVLKYTNMYQNSLINEQRMQEEQEKKLNRALNRAGNGLYNNLKGIF